MKQSTAIRRATRQAHHAMRDLDTAGGDELARIYADAAAQVRSALALAAGQGDWVAQERLRPLLAQIQAIIDQLSEPRDDVIARAIDEAARLGVRPYTAQGLAAVGGADAAIDSLAAQRVHQAAVNMVRALQAADGLRLSDRLWRIDQGAKEALSRAIGQAVVQGWSAQQAATELLQGGQPVPEATRSAWQAARVDTLANMATELLTNPKSSARWQAERVMRTEINRAHGEAYMAAGEGTRGFAGWRYLLSPQHPAPDICDLLSTQNLHGLGPGVYPDRASCPWPAHPNTLSFVVMVFEDEITPADRAGRETSMQALARLSPEQRRGALGVTKAEYFDRGLLRTGMIRAPLRAVEARLERQSRMVHPNALVNWESATGVLGKLKSYTLSPTHPRGKHKARVLAHAGFTLANADDLERQILEGLPHYPAKPGGEDQFGSRFSVSIPVESATHRVRLRTGWNFDPGSSNPRMVTAYVDNAKRDIQPK